MKLRMTLAAATLLALPVTALAGPFADFEGALRGAYGDYRTALFQSNAGKAEATATALAALAAQWDAMAATWVAAPPPQYADDADFAATFAAVDALIAAAEVEVQAGKLAEAHETLEGIRDQIGGLHMRNGLYGFSDRMNAYHAVMEEVLAKGVPADGALGPLAEEAAVLAFLAADIAAHPAPEAADPAYAPLVAGMLDSVAALQAAARSGDAEAAKAAVGALKVPYAKLFAKFG